MIKAGIVGGSGYVAGELLRSLIHHPKVEIDFIFSHSHAGKKAQEIHHDLFNRPDLVFTDQVNSKIEVLFLCLGHGNSSKFLSNNHFSENTKIIDLSNDFRLKADAVFEKKEFVYGLVDLNRAAIKSAKNIANPGCFATAIQLGLLPLAKNQLLVDEVHINAITGATGAGQSLTNTSHFSWRNNNISTYKEFTHQHLGEIGESVVSLQKNMDSDLNFIPVRGDFTRGIFATIYTVTSASEEDLVKFYETFYQNEPFTHVTKNGVDLKQVINTNHALVQVKKHGNKAFITVAIDNLVKGAAGQAIQNMNLMCGLEEDCGLNFKASYF